MLLLYLALTVRLVMSGSTDICCSPKQYECQEGLLTGSVDDESHSAATFGTIAFSYDGTNQRIYEDLRLTVTNMSRNYKILQFYKQNLEYIIEGNVCTHAKPETSWRPSCIPSNATMVPSYILGHGNHTLTVKEYMFQMGTNTISIGVTGNCIPVIYKSYGEIRGQHVMTFTGFQNLTLGIHDPAIFDVPDICKHAKAATEAYRRARRSLITPMIHH